MGRHEDLDTGRGVSLLKRLFTNLCSAVDRLMENGVGGENIEVSLLVLRHLTTSGQASRSLT
jgi:hypothetical protein